MMNNYKFIVVGIDANGNTYRTESHLNCDFIQVFQLGMQDSFQQLTEGKAVYGHPGEGCTGPYSIESVAIVKR